MFASIEEAVEYWKDELSYVEDAKITGYEGGYPIVEFTIKDAAWGEGQEKISKDSEIIRDGGRNRSWRVNMFL